MLDARYALIFLPKLNKLQRGLSAIAELLVSVCCGNLGKLLVQIRIDSLSACQKLVLSSLSSTSKQHLRTFEKMPLQCYRILKILDLDADADEFQNLISFPRHVPAGL